MNFWNLLQTRFAEQTTTDKSISQIFRFANLYFHASGVILIFGVINSELLFLLIFAGFIIVTRAFFCDKLRTDGDQVPLAGYQGTQSND